MLENQAAGGTYTNTEENMKQEGIILFAGMFLHVRQVHVSYID